MDLGGHEFGSLHPFCRKFLPPTDEARLAFVGSILGVHRRSLYGDVWLPLDDLPIFRLAGKSLSRRQSLFARLGASVVHAVWSQGRSPFRYFSHPQLRFHF